MGNLVDLHCHILPQLDDGSPDLEHSLMLASQAVNDGITHILATPHHLDKNYVNHRIDVIKNSEKFQKALNEKNIPLKVFPGQEVHIVGNLIEKYDDLLGIDVKKNYILLELPHGDVPAYTERIIFELRKLGTIPVIVHPERNVKIQKNQNILYKFIQMGALAQLTATSYVGGFGESVEKISKKLISHGLVQIIASDAHTLNGRGFVLNEALNKISNDFGENQIRIFKKNAENMLNGQGIVRQKCTPVNNKKRKFFIF